MSFPHHLQNLVLDYTEGSKANTHKESFQNLSKAYRADKNISIGHHKTEVDAYLLGRLPLTYALLEHVFSIMKEFMPERFSCIDFGCGPATALLALSEVFQEASIDYLGIEQKASMIDAACFFSEKLSINAEFLSSNAEKMAGTKKDLAIASFLLNELNDLKSFFEVLCSSADTIVCIEPGTPDGFERILKLRDFAIANQFNLIAPCPHAFTCPKKVSNWCHFSKRVARTKELKFLKEGKLGYEDEKFCYLVISKNLKPLHKGVIVDHPQHLNFKISMNVCDITGQIVKQEIFKKDKEEFKKAKKLNWGDFIC